MSSVKLATSATDLPASQQHAVASLPDQHDGAAAAAARRRGSSSSIESITSSNAQPTQEQRQRQRLFIHPSFANIRHSITHFIAKEGPLRRDYSNVREFCKEASLLFAYIFAGWNDATAGAILPAIQERYNLSFSVVSLLFVSNLVGWIAAAFITPELIKRLTFGRTITLVTSLAIIPAVIIAAGSPFPVMVCAYALFGLSIGSMDAVCNAWIAVRPNARVRLGALHFAYGLGALCAPLAGSPFVVKGFDFHYFYFASLGLCVCNTVFVTASFRFRKEGYPDEELNKAQHHLRQQQQTNGHSRHSDSNAHPPNETTDIELRQRGSQRQSIGNADTPVATPATSTQGMLSITEAQTTPTQSQQQREHTTMAAQWKTIMRQRDTHIFALFCLFYVGTEVAIGGWTSTYIIRVRGEVDNSGHIVSGFWAGLAAGRVLLIPITSLLGLRVATLTYLALSIALQFVVWFVPSVIASGVSVGIQGLLLGPIFPVLVELISARIIPRSAQTLALAYIIALGSAGSALFPLIVGLIIQSHGAQTLAPTLVAFLSAQACIFLLLGKPRNEAARATD